MSVKVTGDTADVELSSIVPADGCRPVEITVEITDAQNNSYTVNLRFLYGDVNQDGVVNSFDLIKVRNRLNQPVDGENFIDDVNLDGQVNAYDLLAVRNELGKPEACPPILT